MRTRLAYSFTTIVFGILLAVCDGNITCWRGYSGRPARKVVCTGRSCFKARYGQEILYDCWYRPEQHGCYLISNTLYCVCSYNLCNGVLLANTLSKDIPTDVKNTGYIQADVLNTGRIPADVLNTGGIPANILNNKGILADVQNPKEGPTAVLNTEGIPAESLNTRGIPADDDNLGGISSDVLNSRVIEANILNTEGILGHALSIGGKTADVLHSGGVQANTMDTGGSAGRLKCWIGQEKRLRKRMCNGSCYKTKIGRVVRYGCFPNKRPDGCKQFGHRSRCFCKEDLCNNGDIRNNVIKTGGTEKDVGLNTGEVQIDLLNTADVPKYVLNSGSITITDINTGGISTDDLNTGGLSADDLYTGGLSIDILKTFGIPSDDIITEDAPSVDLTIGGEQTRVLETGSTGDILCWLGENKRIRKKKCHFTCYKTEVRGDLLYGCLYSKKPDGCNRYGRKTICFCNTNLCNTGSIPNNNTNGVGIPQDDLDRRGMSTDDQDTEDTPTDNSGSIPTYGLEAKGKPTKGPNTRSIPTNDLNTRFYLLNDELSNAGIPSEPNTEMTPYTVLNTKGVSTNSLITGDIPNDETGGKSGDNFNFGLMKTDPLNSGSKTNVILRTNKQKMTTVLKMGVMPDDELHTENMPTDILHSEKMLKDELHTDKMPTNILHHEMLPSDVLRTDKMSTNILFFKPNKN